MKIAETMLKIMSSKILQTFLIWFLLVAFGSLIGYGDIIQNVGSRYNPPNWWLGAEIKGFGLLGISIFSLFFYKIYRPKIFTKSAETDLSLNDTSAEGR